MRTTSPVLALAAVLGSALLWAVALGELTQHPTTHTGTQPYNRTTL
jgi:hypothetical protein